MRPPRIGLLHSGNSSALATLADPALGPYRVHGIYLPEADPLELEMLDVIIVSDRLHAGQRARFEPALRDALEDADKTVIVLGLNTVERWLPSLSYTYRPTVFWAWRTGEDNGTRLCLENDQLWDYFTPRAMDWHHHGLLHPPEGAKSLVTMEEEGNEIGTILFIDDVNQPARLLVTTMDPVYHHGAGFMPGATQLLYSLLRWATATHVCAAALHS